MKIYNLYTINGTISKCEWMNLVWGGEKKTMNSSFILEIPGHEWVET